MVESKSTALPLGDVPKNNEQAEKDGVRTRGPERDRLVLYH